MRKHYYLKDVVTLKLDKDKCNGCGMCIKVCPHAVFDMNEKKAIISDRDACMECGACSQNCPVQAIEVRAGVGCANMIISSALSGTAPSCGPSDCSQSTTTGN
jgi:NAD-dependent dihydropyrimidine dehydrogenase PreA subunit